MLRVWLRVLIPFQAILPLFTASLDLRLIDKAQQNIVNLIKATNEVNNFLGKPLFSPSPLPPPDRTKITSKAYCIAIMKKARTD
jgi:hypothetical protein